MKLPGGVVDCRFLGAHGVFYAGGRVGGVPGKSHVHGQMFVEVYVPKEIRHPYPVIFFHGAGQTNVNWIMTPDGRKGWADYFVEHGYVVYLAEQPARGRSAYHPEDDGPRIYHSMEALKKRFVSNEGEWEQSKLHSQWPGETEEEKEAYFLEFARSQVEYLANRSAEDNAKAQQMVLDCAEDLLRHTGPAILLTHSQAGPFGWLIADRFHEQVKGIVALEPSGPPFAKSRNGEWGEKFGIASLPLRFEPEVNDPAELEPETVRASREGDVDGLALKKPFALPNLRSCPVLLITSEASYHAGFDYLTSLFLAHAGVRNDFVRLGDVGIHGNGHMMMLEKNNLEIADLILDWLKKFDGECVEDGR